MPHQTSFSLLSYSVAMTLDTDPQRCWANAASALRAFPNLFPFGWYVEGWVVVPQPTSIRILEHGWCRTADDVIVDPTIIFHVPLTQSCIYIPSRHYGREAVLAIESLATLPLVRTGTGPATILVPEHHAAYLRAVEQAIQLSGPSGIPITTAFTRHLPPPQSGHHAISTEPDRSADLVDKKQSSASGDRRPSPAHPTTSERRNK